MNWEYGRFRVACVLKTPTFVDNVPSGKWLIMSTHLIQFHSISGIVSLPVGPEQYIP